MMRRPRPDQLLEWADLIAVVDKMGGESYQLAPSVVVLPKGSKSNHGGFRRTA